MAINAQLKALQSLGRKVGSYFKACYNCGSYDVWEAYNPKWVGWKHWCYTCGAKNDNCWEDHG